jgi:predicted TPR repeat methyltransferase
VSSAPEQTPEATDSSRELTLDEALAVAILLQKNEDYAAAHEVYRRVLEAAPEHPRALHYAGLLAHQQGRNDEALALIERGLVLQPNEADWHSNLGIVLQSAARLDEAIDAYRSAIAIDPSHANAHNNLGVLLRARGEPAEAEAAYRTAIRLDPAHIDAWTNLGILLNALKRTQEAAACYSKVITLRPKHRDARKLLAMAHCTLGEVDEAAGIFEEWLAEEPDDPIARHMLAACTGRGVPQRASDGFVRTTFDSFAASFESKLAKLSYRAPALIAAMLAECGLEPAHRLDVLDAGCGTGLCGTLVAPFARTLSGVDLSEGMLKQAAEKNIYQTITRAELTAYLRDHHETFDLIVSADTLVYFGELSDVIATAARALRPNGLLVFTLEHAIGQDDTAYRLERHGRYSHGQNQVERLLTTAGLRPKIAQAELRMEAGTPVPGLVVGAVKAAG